MDRQNLINSVKDVLHLTSTQRNFLSAQKQKKAINSLEKLFRSDPEKMKIVKDLKK